MPPQPCHPVYVTPAVTPASSLTRHFTARRLGQALSTILKPPSLNTLNSTLADEDLVHMGGSSVVREELHSQGQVGSTARMTRAGTGSGAVAFVSMAGGGGFGRAGSSGPPLLPSQPAAAQQAASPAFANAAAFLMSRPLSVPEDAEVGVVMGGGARGRDGQSRAGPAPSLADHQPPSSTTATESRSQTAPDSGLAAPALGSRQASWGASARAASWAYSPPVSSTYRTSPATGNWTGDRERTTPNGWGDGRPPSTSRSAPQRLFDSMNLGGERHLCCHCTQL